MFADMELIGVPYRITVGDRGLKQGVVEINSRHDGENREIALQDAVSHLQSLICPDS